MVAFDATYFGDESGAGLFGLLQHTTRSRASDESVLICYPAPQETMRTYWAYKHLAHELASLGIQSLRFDYSGTGDSLGDSQGLNCERWQADILCAMRYLRTTTRPAKVTVIASRLGALLAAHALKDTALHRLILWDPIDLGPRYLGELERTHQAMLAVEFGRHVPIRDIAVTDQLVGFPVSTSARTQLQSLAWTWPQRAKSIHIISSSSDGTKGLEAALAAAQPIPTGTQLSYYSCLDPMLWSDPKALRIQAFPQYFLRLVQQIMEGSGT